MKQFQLQGVQHIDDTTLRCVGAYAGCRSTRAHVSKRVERVRDASHK